MKNAFDGLSNSLDTAEERINDIEMSVGTYETMQRDRTKKFKQDMQEPWDNYKRCYICIIGKKKERGMEETIETMMIGKTSFIVAHRLSTIKEADIILVMKDGNVIEKGSHKELIMKNGFYKELFDSQFPKKK